MSHAYDEDVLQWSEQQSRLLRQHAAWHAAGHA
jgi:hypothetical protein